MGFFSSRKAEPTPLSLSELNASPGSVKVIKSRFYGKSKSTTTNTIAPPNTGTLSSSSASGSNMNSSVNFPASTSSQPIPSSSQPQPLRHVSTDPLTTTLAEKLNELALANADGLLDDEAHRLLRQNLFERFAQAEAQSQSAAWSDVSPAPAGSSRKRFSGGYGSSTRTSASGSTNKGTSNTWRNSNLVPSSSSNHQSASKTLNRAPSIESQRSIATAVSSLFRRATRRSGSSHSRGPTSLDGFSQDGDHLPEDYDIEHQETSSLYSRPSFSSNYRRNNPYSSAYGSMIRGVMPRQLSNDSLASVGTGVGSVAGSVAGSVSVAGFPSHLQIHSSHFGGTSVPPSPSSASAAIDLRALSVPRRMQGNYASSISSRTTSRSNKPPSSFHLRHGTSAPSSPQNQPPLPPFPPTRLSISALVRERSHEDDIEDDEYAYGYDEMDEKKTKDQHSSSSGSKPLKSAAALRAEIEAVEVEGRKVFDAFNALELSVLTKGGRMHVGGGSPGAIGSVPEETSLVTLDAISIKSAKSGSGKDKGGSSASTSGMSGSTVPTIGSSSMTGSMSTSTSTSNNSATTATTTSATSISIASSPNTTSLSPPPPHPALHTSHSSPSLLTNPASTLTPKSKLRLTAYASHASRDGTSDVRIKDAHLIPAIPISSPPKRRPSILLQRKKTGKTKVVLPPSIAAASLEIREERERERDKDGVGVGVGTGTSHSIATIASSSSQAVSPVSTTTSALTDRSTTRVRTRSHSRERPAREKPPPSLQAQYVPPVPRPPQPRSPSPLPPIPALSSIIPKLYPKHPYADTSLALSVVIPDSSSDIQSQQQEQSVAPHSSLSSLTDELDAIRKRRATVTKRYERRLEFLHAKLKSAEIREMLK